MEAFQWGLALASNLAKIEFRKENNVTSYEIFTRICQFNRDDKRPWYIEISKIPVYDAEKSAFERQRQEKKYLAEHNEQRLKIFHFFLISHTCYKFSH